MGTARSGICGVTRRGFLLGAATGVATGAAAVAIPTRFGWRIPGVNAPHFTGKPAEDRQPEYAMPGPYPGRVVEVRDPYAVADDNEINAEVVNHMIDRGMGELTGADPRDVKAAWGRFFDKEDVVGLKVNPVGRKRKPGDWTYRPGNVGSISSFPVVIKIVRCLQEVGIPAKNIILFERYGDEFIDAGYADLVEKELPKGVRWYASSAGYSETQLDINGFDRGHDGYPPDLSKHVAGYDPDVFTSMGFSAPEHSPRDDRRFRSHLSAIVTRMCSKVINLPVLKDHRSAGVTLALKNMSHGMNNNVARSHLGGVAHGFGDLHKHINGPNQCNTFIPQAVAHRKMREKVVLHIMDGLIGVYEGGPGAWNRTWATWRHKGMFFGTDPVAMDHVGWDIIDKKRAEEGWPSVARMGSSYNTPAVAINSSLSRFSAATPLESAVFAMVDQNRQSGRASETFNLRTPEHVILAGKLGLGLFEQESIMHKVVTL